jgi:hypothetical protein
MKPRPHHSRGLVHHPSKEHRMFDHLGFGVSDYAASKAFFLAALKPLGVGVVMEGPHGLGIGKAGKPSLWLPQAGVKSEA